MVMMKISYQMRAHHIPEYEQMFQTRVLPLIREHGLRFRGIWRTLVGDAGEYLELWEFESLGEFEEQWKALYGDPRLQEVFERTGPMVEGEKISLLEPVFSSSEGGDSLRI